MRILLLTAEVALLMVQGLGPCCSGWGNAGGDRAFPRGLADPWIGAQLRPRFRHGFCADCALAAHKGRTSSVVGSRCGIGVPRSGICLARRPAAIECCVVS